MPTLPSVCPLDCPDRCSLSVTVEGGRVTALTGSHAHPWTDGYICHKVKSFHRRAHGPERLQRPKLRVGPPGPGARFAEVSWAVALERVAARIRSACTEHGALSVLPCNYGGSNGALSDGGMDRRFWNRLGATRLDRTLCASNTSAATALVYPGLASSAPGDVQHADTIVLWGVNPSDSGIHLVGPIRKAQRRGAKLVVVDPRRTPLAAKADLHLAVLPGSDVALAMAVAGELFRTDRADLGFLEANAVGWTAWRDAALAWTPQRAAATCGLEASDITRLAAMMADGDPTFLRCGWGVERNRNGTDSVRAILALPAVLGSFGRRGAGWCMSTSSAYRMDKAAAQDAPGGPPRTRTVNQSQLARAVEELRDPPVQVLYVYDCNPVATLPDQQRVRRALSRPDLFVVVHEQVHTDTCDYADVVLPATTFLEHAELSTGYGAHAVQWADPVIEPVGEARSNHDVFRALAAALGWGDEPALAATEADVARALLAGTGALDGVSLEDLRAERIAVVPSPVQLVDAWPDGPIQLGDPPVHRPAPADLPLALISPASRKAISSTCFEAQPAGSARVDLHPVDAGPRGISTGDRVRLSNPLGEVVVVARVTDRVRPGVASLPKGLWARHTLNGATANALVPDHVDELGGGGCFNDARVEVERI